MPTLGEYRIKWFKFDLEAMAEDPRMKQLTIAERGRWMVMLAHMWRSQGMIIDDEAVVAEIIGTTPKEARKFMSKLVTIELLHRKATGTIGQKLHLFNNRCLREFWEMQQVYHNNHLKGKKSGEVRALHVVKE